MIALEGAGFTEDNLDLLDKFHAEGLRHLQLVHFIRNGLGDRQTIHGLRHDYASLLAELGVPVRGAMELLGHSNELMTVYYQHVSRAAKREAVSKLGDWLQQVSG